MATRKQRYDISLNGQGLILANSPEQPLINARQKALYNSRYAQGDRSYTDFEDWWYMAQTDWSRGFKDSPSWSDDTKFYASTNIDAYSEQGAIKIENKQVDKLTANAEVICGIQGLVGNATRTMIGSYRNTGTGRPELFIDSGAGFSTVTDLATNQYAVSHISIRNTVAWIHTNGVGTTGVIRTWNGTLYTDQTSKIGGGVGAPIGWAPESSPCGTTVGTKYYVFIEDRNNHRWGIVSTSSNEPGAASDYTLVTQITQTFTYPIACAEYDGSLYYLLMTADYQFDLYVYNPLTSATAFVYHFTRPSVVNVNNYGVGDKMLKVYKGKLYITVPPNQIWSFDGNDMAQIFNLDKTKSALGAEYYPSLSKGSVVSEGRLYWANLVYDGENFFNWIKSAGDTSNPFFYPLFSDGSEDIWGMDDLDNTKVYSVSGTCKSGADKNWLVFSNFDNVSGLDKLGYSATIIFKTLSSGQKVVIEYTTGELTSSTTWTTLGSVNHSSDGAIATKTFYFGDNVIFKKIWFRAKLENQSAGVSPVLYDFVLAYLPMPDYKLQWDFTVKCEDIIQRKDNSKETKNGLYIRNYLLKSWQTKSILSFEDYDANAEDFVSGVINAGVTTITVKGSTDNFPEIGRIMIDSEEIFYSGKNKTQFLNCVRGSRGTNAVSHIDGSIVSMKHRVRIDDYRESLIIANEPGKAEYLVSITLKEV